MKYVPTNSCKHCQSKEIYGSFLEILTFFTIFHNVNAYILCHSICVLNLQQENKVADFLSYLEKQHLDKPAWSS